MAVHEFADESARTAGQRVTVPYHAKEYGFQLRLNEVVLAPVARRVFERFLEHVRFEPPALQTQAAFGGRFRIGLPEGFVADEKTSGADRMVWRSTLRRNCTIGVVRCLERHVPMSPNLLLPLLKGCPRPQETERSLAKSRFFALRENRFRGYCHYRATDTRGWSAAVGD